MIRREMHKIQYQYNVLKKKNYGTNTRFSSGGCSCRSRPSVHKNTRYNRNYQFLSFFKKRFEGRLVQCILIQSQVRCRLFNIYRVHLMRVSSKISWGLRISTAWTNPGILGFYYFELLACDPIHRVGLQHLFKISKFLNHILKYRK